MFAGDNIEVKDKISTEKKTIDSMRPWSVVETSLRAPVHSQGDLLMNTS